MSIRDISAFTDVLHHILSRNKVLEPLLTQLLYITKQSNYATLGNTHRVIWVDLARIYEELYAKITSDTLCITNPSRPSPVLVAHPLYIFLAACAKFLNSRSVNVDHLIVTVRKIQLGYQQVQYNNYPEVDINRLTQMETDVVEQLYGFIKAVLKKANAA
nr:ORF9 [Acipenserid herpesvirus 1]